MTEQPTDNEVIYISAPQPPEEVMYQTLAIVHQELRAIETLLSQGKLDAAHQQLQQFMSEIQEKQAELLEQITPF